MRVDYRDIAWRAEKIAPSKTVAKHSELYAARFMNLLDPQGPAKPFA